MKITYQSFITKTSEQNVEFQKMAMLPHLVRYRLRYYELENENGETITEKVMVDLLPYDWNCDTPNIYDGKYRVLSFHIPYDLWLTNCHKVYDFLSKQLKQNLNACMKNPSINESKILAF